MSDPKIIDLPPAEYQRVDGPGADEPKRREPILAPGWYWGVLALLSVFAVKAAIFLSVRALH